MARLAVSNSQWLRPGWSWPGRTDPQNKLPTFMKAIVRREPPPFPAGLSKTGLAAQERWHADSCRFPPYQYEEKHLVHHGDLPPRLVDASERELLLGLGPGHTATCRSASAVTAMRIAEKPCVGIHLQSLPSRLWGRQCVLIGCPGRDLLRSSIG